MKTHDYPHGCTSLNFILGRTSKRYVACQKYELWSTRNQQMWAIFDRNATDPWTPVREFTDYAEAHDMCQLLRGM